MVTDQHIEKYINKFSIYFSTALQDAYPLGESRPQPDASSLEERAAAPAAAAPGPGSRAAGAGG